MRNESQEITPFPTITGFDDTRPKPDVAPRCCTGECDQGRNCPAWSDDEQEDDLGAFRGIVNAIGLVAGAMFTAWVLVLIVDALWGGK